MTSHKDNLSDQYEPIKTNLRKNCLNKGQSIVSIEKPLRSEWVVTKFRKLSDKLESITRMCLQNYLENGRKAGRWFPVFL